MDIGAQIREAREKAGLSQPALAKKAGLTKSEIQKIEYGQRFPRANTLKKLCEALNLKITIE